jgi:hypothetical protein
VLIGNWLSIPSSHHVDPAVQAQPLTHQPETSQFAGGFIGLHAFLVQRSTCKDALVGYQQALYLLQVVQALTIYERVQPHDPYPFFSISCRGFGVMRWYHPLTVRSQVLFSHDLP